MPSRSEGGRAQCRRIRAGAAAALLALLAACAGQGDTSLGALGDALARAGGLGGGRLDEATIADGLKEALRVGARQAVSRTGRVDGFWERPRIRIPLPEELETLASGLRTVGLGERVDALELQMNRAAERAAGEAAPVLLDAVESMTLADARRILEGPETAATDYLRRSTGDALRARFEPIVETKIQEVGLARLYQGTLQRYRDLPLAASLAEPPELDAYVTDRTLDGLFTVLGEEEARIREDPAARTTELLRRVFGGS